MTQHAVGPFTDEELDAAIKAAVGRLADSAENMLPDVFLNLDRGLELILRGHTFTIGFKAGEIFERVVSEVRRRDERRAERIKLAVRARELND